jgi:NAD(P)-dependent dehydrogenase (short-subunit alcohol dehydrogenase family)
MASSAGMGTTEDVWDKGIATTLSSVYWMSKAAISLLTAPGGAIVNISSLAGNYVATSAAWYAGAKAGVVGVTRSFATTYGPMGIRTNAICLGAIDTPRIRVILDLMPGQEEIHNQRSPLGRMGKPEEIAACVLFLASDEASFINGNVMVADGGFTLVT